LRERIFLLGSASTSALRNVRRPELGGTLNQLCLRLLDVLHIRGCSFSPRKRMSCEPG
jgi:hypothetical protein